MEKSFKVRCIDNDSALKIIEETGFDKSYIHKAINKYKFKLIKINDLTCPQASIIKQLALSIGADAALHREVLTHKVDKTDLVIGATISQLSILCQKMRHQPFKLPKLANEIEEVLKTSPQFLQIRKTLFQWGQKSYIMGILNITPDSFSDGGRYTNIDTALNHATEMIECGVDIIDIGGESTRPYSEEVPPSEEIKRIIPVIKKIRETYPDIPISIDTRHSETAKASIEAGADIINDVSGFDKDANMMKVVTELQVPVIIMHSQGTPENMQDNPNYGRNIVDEVYQSLEQKISDSIKAGIKKENIIIDPGVGFGKTQEHNIELIKRISEFKSLGCAILVGISRKSVISNIIKTTPEERDDSTVSLNAYLCEKGTDIIRVHNVKKHTGAFTVLDKIIR